MKLQKNDFILFTGDSITDAGRKRPLGEGLWEGVGSGFVRTVDDMLNAFYPELNIRIANTGVNGNTSRDLLARWQEDVLNFQPDWLHLCIGVNDVWRHFDEPILTYKHVSLQEYADNLDKMLASAKTAVKKGIIVMSPYIMEPQLGDQMRAEMDLFREAAKAAAEKHGAAYIDIQAVFDRYFTIRHSSYISWDRIHPSHAACVLMAREVLDRFGLELSLTDK